MARLDPRAMVLATVGVVGLGAAVCWVAADFVFFGPLRSDGARLASLQAELSALQDRRAAAEIELADARSQASAGLSGDLLFGGSDVSDASASFQGRVRETISRVGGVLVSLQVSNDALAHETDRMQLLLRARFDERSMFEFLRAIESEPPIVIVDALEARTAPGTEGQPPLDFMTILVAFHGNAS